MASARGASQLESGDAFDRKQGASPQCSVQVILDGLAIYRGERGEKLFDLNTISPTQLAGVEDHTPATTPQQFAGRGGGCGTLVIWTRMRY
jgi:hypothetical protein